MHDHVDMTCVYNCTEIIINQSTRYVDRCRRVKSLTTKCIYFNERLDGCEQLITVEVSDSLE